MTNLAVGFVAGRYLTSGGELNWLKDTGQVPRSVTPEIMAGADIALRRAGDDYRPDMDKLTSEQRGQFLTGAAEIGRTAQTRSSEDVRQSLEMLHRSISGPQVAKKEAQQTTALTPVGTGHEKIERYWDELSARYGNLDEPETVPTPAPVPAPAGSDDDERKRLNVGTRTVLVVRDAAAVREGTRTAIVDGAITYIHVPKDPTSDHPRNLIVHRLIHDVSSNTNPGHDAIHLISGFGLNGKGAKRIPLAFPSTQLDAPAMPVQQQRNINGLAIEATTDGLYEALKKTIQPGDEPGSSPERDPTYRDLLLVDLDARTGKPNGKPVELKDIPPGSDIERQVYELAGAGAGLLSIDAASGNFKYIPAPPIIDIHTRNFEALLNSNAAVRRELVGNLNTYIDFMADVARAASEGREPPRSRLEMTVSPQTTRALIETALKSYQELHALYPTSPAFPELIIHYRTILQRGEDGIPIIVQAPGGEVSRTG